jgi:hypothetical protein
MLKKLNHKMLCFFGVALLATSPLWAQVATEVPATKAAVYPAQWAVGPLTLSVPEWAKPGRIRFTRWDGGAIKTAKAFLSGWPYFNPPLPDYVYTMTNWYDPRTVALLREASFNVVWVTFSNGFSIPTERSHQEQVRQYIEECHRQGIHVMAYESIANMFWEDMYEHVPESRNWVSIDADGKPVPYGAGDYTKMGRVTRYMADLSKPEWRDYLKKRIDLAIDAGADGIMYDNCSGPYLGETLEDIYRYAASRKPDMLIMANFHNSDFIFNRLLNAMTTEEGGEAGIFSEENVLHDRFKEEKPFMLRVGGGLLANNIGRFRIFQNLPEGWKPVHIESRMREVGWPETDVMSAERQQLVLAENMMFSTANETFVEGAFAYRLMQHDPETMKIWRAVGVYNRFFADNEEYYTDTRSLASLAVVLDNRSEGVPLLNGLAGRGVIFDVLYEHELTPEKLKPYAAVALLTAKMVRDRSVKALEEYLAGGGKVVAAGNVATQDERGSPRPQPSFLRTKTASGECLYFEKLPPMDELARVLLAADRHPLVNVVAPKGVLYNVVEQPKSGRVIVHLLNYTLQPVPSIRVTARGNFGRVKRLTPDSIREPVQVTASSSAATEVQVPSLEIYSILVFDRREEPR